MGKGSRMANIEVICNIAFAACIPHTESICVYSFVQYYLKIVWEYTYKNVKYIITRFYMKEEN